MLSKKQPQKQRKQTAQKKVVKNLAPRKKRLNKRKQQRRKGAGKEVEKSQFQDQKVVQVISPSYSTQQVKNITVQADFLESQLQWALIGVASYLAQKGMVNNTVSTGVPQPWATVYDGLSYLLSSMNTLIQGGTVNVATMPQFALDLVAALSPKGVKYHEYSKVQYSWNAFTAAQTVSINAVVGPNVWNTTWVADTDTGTYLEVANVYASPAGGDPEQYAPLLKLLGNIAYVPALQTVPSESESVLERDASAFARVYRYNGLTLFGPNAGGGYYKDAENEVNITAPMMCNYVAYLTPDVRVPQKLIACSGDAQSNLGTMFLEHYVSPFNKVPPVYKMIDFEEIYTFCVLWMCKLKEAIQVNAAQAPADNIYALPLPFSQQDFRIMLRQALLNVFETQPFVQAIGLTQYGASTNTFLPFMVMGHCYGATPFNQLLLPQLMVENLNALKARSLRINAKTSKASCPLFIPVLGNYYQDTPTSPQYNFGGDMTPLFSPLVQVPIDITNCVDEANENYINVNNGYYQGVLGDWNNHVQGLSGVSVKTCPIVKDNGPLGMGVLYFTRIEDVSFAEAQRRKGIEVAAPAAQYQVQSLRYLRNPPVFARKKSLEQIELEQAVKKIKADGGEITLKKTAIPPASVTELSVIVETSSRPLLAEEEAFLGAIITPVARLSNTEDAATINMYQIETTEGLTTFYTNRASSGTGMYAKLASLAGICVTGLAKEKNSSYIDIMSHLERHSKAGMLSELLGGVVKSIIPNSGPIVDTIAGFLPF